MHAKRRGRSNEVEWAQDQFQKPSAITFVLHGKISIEEQKNAFKIDHRV